MSQVNKTAGRSATKGLATKGKAKKTKDYSSFRMYVRGMLLKELQSRADPRVQMQDAVYANFNKIIRNLVQDVVANAYDVVRLQKKKTIDGHAMWCAYKRLFPDAAAKSRDQFDSLIVPQPRKSKAAKAAKAAEPVEQEAPKAPRAKRARKERKGKAAPVESAAHSDEENSE